MKADLDLIRIALYTGQHSVAKHAAQAAFERIKETLMSYEHCDKHNEEATNGYASCAAEEKNPVKNKVERRHRAAAWSVLSNNSDYQEQWRDAGQHGGIFGAGTPAGNWCAKANTLAQQIADLDPTGVNTKSLGYIACEAYYLACGRAMESAWSSSAERAWGATAAAVIKAHKERNP